MAKSNLVEIVIGVRDQASSALNSLTAKLTGVATLVASYFGVTLFTSAVKGAADLEAGMSRIQAASGATVQEMEALKKAAVDAGATTKYTATEAASALETLSKSGLSAKDAIAALPAVLNLAQAGDIALAQSADFVSKAVKGMGLEFSDAGRVADVLAMGANASSTSVTGLAEAMSYTAPVARSAKLSLEETVAIIGKFADSGIDASRAGTALNSILSQFIDPASKFRQELAGAGIVTDNFSVALRQLAAAGPKGQQAILAVGLESGPALRALLNQGIGALDELKTKLDQSGGSAAKTAAIMEGNLKGSFSGLASAWDTVKIALGEPVLPVLTDAVKQLTAGITEAVSNGTIGRFGTAIATGFQSAITWVKAFVAEADLGQTTAKLQDFAQRMGENLQKVGEYATNAGNLTKLAYGLMSAGANAVMAAVYAVSSAFADQVSNIQAGIAIILTGLSKITFGGVSQSFKDAAADIRLSAEATGAASTALAAKATAALGATGDSAQTARTAFAALTKEADKTTVAHTAGAAAIAGVATKLQELGDKAPSAAQKQIEAAAKTRESVAALKLEYEAAMAAGNIQLAAQKQQQLRDELEKTKGQATLTKDALQSAFESLGITSQAKLKESADAAQRLFDILKASGQATALDLKNAFGVLAQRMLDAAGSVGSVARAAAQSTLEAKAGAQGLSVEFDAAGKVVVRSMAEGVSAIQNIVPAANGAAGAVSGIGAAAQATAEQLKAAAAEIDRINRRYGKPTSSAEQVDLENPYGKTNDGFTANKDGSAKGTFTNTLAVDQAFALVDKNKAGTLTAADLDSAKAAFQQAQNALNYMWEMGKLNPGGQSLEFVQSTQALYNGTRAAYEKVQALAQAAKATSADGQKPASAGAPAAASTAAPAQTYLVKIDLGGGKSYDVNTASANDAQTLISALQSAKRGAGM